tara:strand:- start:19200 stop:20273 length:1074 start_codon:yes stop_codon:yes gene_type:complete
MTRFIKPLKLICIFLCALLIFSGFTGWALSTYAPNKPSGLITEKLDYLRHDRLNENVIFLGTSQTFRNVNPKIFDSRAETQGCRFTSYNAGVPGLTLEEMMSFIEVLSLSGDKEGARLVFFTDPLPPKPVLQDAKSTRTQNYSSIQDLKYRMENVWSLPEPVWKRFALTGFAGLSHLYAFLNIGDISYWLFPQSYDAQADGLGGLSMQKGFPSLSYDIENDETIRKRSDLFQAEHDIWQKNVLDKQLQTDAQDISHDIKPRAKLLGKIAASLSEKGDTPILVIHPEPETLAQDIALAQTYASLFPDYKVVSFANPRLYPRLWDAANWFDKTHLNENGAKILSADLANKACAFMKEGR